MLNHKLSRFFLVIITAACFSACSSSDPEFASIKPTYTNTPIKLIELADELDIIEVKTQSIIGGVPTILANDTHLFIFDRDYSRTLFKIDLKGNVLASVQFGEDDKLNIHGITNLVLKGGQVGVITMGETINWFDENLENIGAEDLPVKGNFHFPFQDGFATFNTHINDLEPWDFFYSKDKVLVRDIPINQEEHKFSYQAISPFTIWRDQLLFTKMLNDTIYSFSGEKGLKRLISIDFGAKQVPTDLMKTIQHPLELMTFFREKKYRYLDGAIYALDSDNVLVLVSDQGNRKPSIWSTKENTITIYPSIIDTSISGLELVLPSLVQDNKLYFGLSGEYLAGQEGIMMQPLKNQLSEEYETSYFIFVLKLKE